MIQQPIQFERNGRINLNRLRLEIDRRVNLITMMVKGMKPSKTEKVCAENCCQVVDTSCQTDEFSQVLTELPQFSLSNTPSIKSLKSPTNAKKTSSKNKENQVILQSASSIASKSKPILISIEESEQEGLKTSRYLNKLESEKKKVKPPPLNISTTKKPQKQSVYGSNASKRQKPSNLNSETKNETQYVVNSFDSNKKKNLTDRKCFKTSTNVKISKEPTTQEKIMTLSFNGSIPDMSESKGKVGSRKGSFNLNESLVANSSNQISRKYPTQSFSTTNMSSVFTTDEHEENPSRVKRMVVGEQVRVRIEEEFEKRLEASKKKTAREPKQSNNNIRMALMKRLEDKHLKTQEVTK